MNLNEICNSEKNADLSNRLVLALQANGRTLQTSAQFSAILTPAGKIDFILDLLTSYSILPEYIKDAKNNKKAVELRKHGNKLFGSRKDAEALKIYTDSVAVAENKSEDLGLAYANRSAVLFKLGLFQDCLDDIERAFRNNYPESLKPKLLERQKNAKELQLNEKKFFYHQSIPTIPKENQNSFIECASNSIEIKSDSKLGRHIVATRDINIGEIIAVEKATFTVLTNQKWCHCHHCLTLCYCLIPCEFCTEALFCSVACKNDANMYHDYECPILATIYSLDLNSCRVLPLRIAILIKNEYKDLKDEIFKADNVYRSGRYKEIHNLVTNAESRSISNLFERASTVALFYHLMKNFTNFFEVVESDYEDTFKDLVLHHLFTMACNFHGIDELERNAITNVYESTTIGAGAYSFLSLFNHSCSPNVCRSGYGTTIVLSAVESIKKGDQLFENYGFHYAMHAKSERQAALKKQYFFECECCACKYNWGTYDTLPQLDSNVSLTLMLNYEKLANADLETARKIEPDVRKAMKKLEKMIPCKDFCKLQELLKQCSSIYGNLRRNLQ